MAFVSVIVDAKRPKFFGILAEPSKLLKRLLSSIPFIIVIVGYMMASDMRHRENPSDKILPTISQMGEAVERMAITPDKRTGEFLVYEDTKISLLRLFMGIGLATVVGLLLGLNMGLYGGFYALVGPFMTFVSIVPPLAILPIIFIAFGVDELSKVMLIFIGTFPLITRSVYQSVKRIPTEQITKSLTLGASPLQIVYRIIMPQILPSLIDVVRLSFGAGWLFLIAGEAIASSSGLGYRIFLVRRYLSMDVIIPYTLWITFLGFSIDFLLRKFVAWKFSWYEAK